MPQISKIGVIGAGNMGSGIAQKIAQEDLHQVDTDHINSDCNQCYCQSAGGATYARAQIDQVLRNHRVGE